MQNLPVIGLGDLSIQLHFRTFIIKHDLKGSKLDQLPTTLLISNVQAGKSFKAVDIFLLGINH